MNCRHWFKECGFSCGGIQQVIINRGRNAMASSEGKKCLTLEIENLGHTNINMDMTGVLLVGIVKRI